MDKCEICGKEFASEAALLQHHNVKHPNEPFRPSPKSRRTKAEPRLKKSGGIRQGLQSKRRKRRLMVLGAALVLVVGLGAVSYSLYNSFEHPSGPFGTFPFPCTTAVSMHIHPYLRITIGGTNISIPSDVGSTSGCSQPMHTHDASGIIHLEAPDTKTQYTLGQFFEIWQVTYGTVGINGTDHPILFNSTDILGFKADATHKVILLVDGQPSSEYGSLVLNSLAYCSAGSTGPPCSPTAVGDPYYGGQPYPFGTGHTVVVEYVTVSG